MKYFTQDSIKKYVAEILGTFVLVFFGCGTAVFAGANIASFAGVALVFGLSIIAVGYSFGRASGTHLNPAVTFAKCLQKQMNWIDGFFYIICQVLGSLFAAALLLGITRLAGNDTSGLGANASSVWSSRDFDITFGRWQDYFPAIIMELILTFVFITIVLFATEKENKFAPLIIGGGLTFVHLLGVLGPTGTSVNPARSFGPAIFAVVNGNLAPIADLWIFIVIPLAASALAWLFHKWISGIQQSKNDNSAEKSAQ